MCTSIKETHQPQTTTTPWTDSDTVLVCSLYLALMMSSCSTCGNFGGTIGKTIFSTHLFTHHRIVLLIKGLHNLINDNWKSKFWLHIKQLPHNFLTFKCSNYDNSSTLLSTFMFSLIACQRNFIPLKKAKSSYISHQQVHTIWWIPLLQSKMKLRQCPTPIFKSTIKKTFL